MKKSSLLSVAAICAVIVSGASGTALRCLLSGGFSSPSSGFDSAQSSSFVLTAPVPESHPYQQQDIGYPGTEYITTALMYGDMDRVHELLCYAKAAASDGKADTSSDLLFESISECAALSEYRKYLGSFTYEYDGNLYGAYSSEETAPIGGGFGYRAIFSTGDYNVTTLTELREALSSAKSGDIIFIDGSAVIDVTYMYTVTPGNPLKLPDGVTLCSDRGRVRPDGSISTGALIRCDALSGQVLWVGEGARVSGIVIRGANPLTNSEHHYRSFSVPEPPMHAYYNLLSTASTDGLYVTGSNAEIDNCEISGFGHAAVFLARIDIKDAYIHHCYIHHNQTAGRGYGISHNNGVTSLIEYNLFNYNRHSIAATGAPVTGYTARYNIEMGESLEHCFDMHGGSSYGREDGTSIAGTYCEIYSNTFLTSSYPYWLRGVPEDYQKFYRNLLAAPYSSYDASRLKGERVFIYDNVFGYASEPEYIK